MGASRVVCPSCSIPFTRHGAAARSSDFYRTQAENDMCVICREGLDPVTFERLEARGNTMAEERLSDAEIVDNLEMGTIALRMARIDNLRKVADQMADVATVAADRLRELSSGRALVTLERRASTLEDAAFHFQTCAKCKTQGDDACTSGRRFAAYLRGEELEEKRGDHGA